MSLSLSRTSRLLIAVIFAVIAVSLAAYEVSVYLREQRSEVRRSHAGVQPVGVQPGVIQHVITRFEPVAASGKVIKVDGRTSVTIQSAIDSAKRGDKVLVSNGVYTESLTLKNGVLLEGEDCNSVIIQCDMRVAPVLKIDGCRSVQVSKLTLKHLGEMLDDTDSTGRWPIVKIDNSGASLEHLVISGGYSDGIRIQNDSTHLDHVVVVACNISDNRSYGILVSGNGNAELENNTFCNNKKNGILFKDVSDGLVKGNLCKGNARNGISIGDNATVDISANTCCDNEWSGIYFGSKSPFNVRGNICRGNRNNGICVENGVSGTVSENTCAENKGSGICLNKNGNPSVENNKCFNNEKCGIYSDVSMLYANDVHDNKEFCRQEVRMYLRAEDFDRLEKMASQIRGEKRRFSNGNWQLDHFYDAFDADSCQRWISKYPASITPRIGLATSLYRQAWSIRGGGYARTVSPTAWGSFEEHLTKALDVLKEAQKLDAKDPGLYVSWIIVGMGLGKVDEIEAAFRKGAEIEPTYYPLYSAHGTAMLPRWYGEPGQYERLAAEAAERTHNEIGQSLYFQLARGMTHYAKTVEEFKEAGFDFARIKQGAKDFGKQFRDFPDNETSNRLCFMACAAGNKEDARDYFMDIGDNWNENVWKNYETFQKYKVWARNRDGGK